MRADAPEEIMIGMDFKCESVKHINARFPAVFMTLHLFGPEGWMMDVAHEKSDLVFKLFLRRLGELFEILLEDIGTEDFHFLRSERKSSMDLNDLVLPVAISLSASASAFFQSKPLKYGGSVRAYFINSVTASFVLLLCESFLYFLISSKVESDKVIVNSRDAIAFLL